MQSQMVIRDDGMGGVQESVAMKIRFDVEGVKLDHGVRHLSLRREQNGHHEVQKVVEYLMLAIRRSSVIADSPLPAQRDGEADRIQGSPLLGT